MSQRKDARLKVVAHKSDGTVVKGYTAGVPGFYKDSLHKQKPTPPPNSLELELADSGKKVKLKVATLKALFFVKTFEGSHGYNEIKFFTAHPLLQGLWVRLTFADKECTEGVIYNSLHFLNDRGFFLKPPDPQSNNDIVYVLKSSLREFRVLGVRNTY